MSLRVTTRRYLDMVPRPLDSVRSMKLKLAILLVASGGLAFAFFWSQIGWLPPRTTITALLGALIFSQLLAHGMTKPLREMTAAARAMARGDYTRRIPATSRDEVGELAHAFNQMAADLAAVDQERRELIANVSHELRTPITALRAVLENLVDGVEKPDPATLSTALAQTERLGLLVGELLDLSRIDAGVLALDREEFELGPLVEEAVAEAEVTDAATGRGIRFAIDVEPPGVRVLADRGRLHQVVINLLDNAARHGPAGGEVGVHVRTMGDDVTIEVRDEGPGIPREERHQVFERFTRGGRAGGGGTGLGLAIVRWVVDLHGGTIAVVDPAGGAPGGHIRVTLPAR
ncbi:HAMP domain-containing sensor histidine kinase [Amycolatopsis sp.]|uniref:HAMP domain-containing sensor histidine kinase n=1 Tax=Amycolatopsis sp. TaxID=37632 RepID=UPI002E07A8E9|nr:HAMP domain-containing sensor histidine kinase [Amycolatopsis sp.]